LSFERSIYFSTYQWYKHGTVFLNGEGQPEFCLALFCAIWCSWV